MRNLTESIKEEFELLKLISRYSNGEVYSKTETESPEIIYLNDSSIFVSTRVGENGKQFVISPKGGVDKNLFKDNFKKHFEEERAKHKDLEIIDFIESQIEFINGISKELAKEYTYVLNALKRSFEQIKTLLLEDESDRPLPDRPNMKNNFDAVNIEILYKHFHEGLVIKKHLEKDQLDNYLKFAFDLKQTPPEQFILSDIRTKQKIVRIFYSYYKSIAGKPPKVKSSYVKLLTDYFIGFDFETTMTSFSK